MRFIFIERLVDEALNKAWAEFRAKFVEIKEEAADDVLRYSLLKFLEPYGLTELEMKMVLAQAPDPHDIPNGYVCISEEEAAAKYPLVSDIAAAVIALAEFKSRDKPDYTILPRKNQLPFPSDFSQPCGTLWNMFYNDKANIKSRYDEEVRIVRVGKRPPTMKDLVIMCAIVNLRLNGNVITDRAIYKYLTKSTAPLDPDIKDEIRESIETLAETRISITRYKRKKGGKRGEKLFDKIGSLLSVTIEDYYNTEEIPPNVILNGKPTTEYKFPKNTEDMSLLYDYSDFINAIARFPVEYIQGSWESLTLYDYIMSQLSRKTPNNTFNLDTLYSKFCEPEKGGNGELLPPSKVRKRQFRNKIKNFCAKNGFEYSEVKAGNMVSKIQIFTPEK